MGSVIFRKKWEKSVMEPLNQVIKHLKVRVLVAIARSGGVDHRFLGGRVSNLTTMRKVRVVGGF